MPVPAARRLALAAAPAVLACALAVPPAAAAGSPELPVAVRAEIGPAPAAGDLRTVEELVPASQVAPGTRSSLLERGQGPLLAVGGAVIALMGAFVAGLSRRPEPVD